MYTIVIEKWTTTAVSPRNTPRNTPKSAAGNMGLKTAIYPNSAIAIAESIKPRPNRQKRPFPANRNGAALAPFRFSGLFLPTAQIYNGRSACGGC
jgi:hypothetical protein